jgi:hypothetical protein
LTASYNLICPQATTFNFQFQINNTNPSTGTQTPWNLTGYTATMTVRPFAGSTTTKLLATTANGLIVLDAVNGRATVTFSNTATDIPANSYVYDFVLYQGSVVTRILEGQFIVTPGVTV